LRSPPRRSRLPPPASRPNAGATASFDFTHAAPYDRRSDMQYQRHPTAEDRQRCRTRGNAWFDCVSSTQSNAIKRNRSLESAAVTPPVRQTRDISDRENTRRNQSRSVWWLLPLYGPLAAVGAVGQTHQRGSPPS